MTNPDAPNERFTVSLLPDSSSALAELQQRTGMKKVDLINRALVMYAWVDRITHEDSTLYVKEAGKQELSMVRFL